MNLLAVDSSSDCCSIALWFAENWQTDNKLLQDAHLINEAQDSTAQPAAMLSIITQQLHQLIERTPQQHSQRLLPMLDELVKQHQVDLNQLDAIAFGAGPGSFTGLRITASMVQGLAFAMDKPIIAVSSLQAMAQQLITEEAASEGAIILAASDARMDEIYWQVFRCENGLAKSQNEVQLSVAAAINGEWSVDIGAGSGWQYAKDIPLTANYINTESTPSAAAVLQIAALRFSQSKDCLSPATAAIPDYVRNTISWKKLSEQ